MSRYARSGQRWPWPRDRDGGRCHLPEAAGIESPERTTVLMWSPGHAADESGVRDAGVLDVLAGGTTETAPRSSAELMVIEEVRFLLLASRARHRERISEE